MFSIRTYNHIAEKGLSEFSKDLYNVSDKEENPNAILVRSAKLHELEFNPQLQAIARAGSGYNNIPVEQASQKGVVVFNTPGANANAVKELVIASLLLSSRKIVEGIQWVQSNAGRDDITVATEKEKSLFSGHEIKGKTLGVIGLGAVGCVIANAATDLHMQVRGYDPYLSIDSAWRISRKVKRDLSLEDLVRASDYITIHIPYAKDSHHFFNATLLGFCKTTTVILNFSRAELVDSEAMKEALHRESIRGYVTDFPTAEMVSHKNVLSIPHLGASTEESEENCAVMAAQQIRQFLEYGTIKNSVNFPNCNLDITKEVKMRLLIVNENIASVIGKITTVLGEYAINIQDMINKHRNGIAYNIIDTDTVVQDEVIKIVQNIKGVLRVRSISLF